jgi:hypothetical protein
MTTSKTNGVAMLSRVSTPYLRALGELHVCELRLRRIARDLGAAMGPSWHEANEFLHGQSEALQERLADGPLVEHALQVQAVDGSMVPADIVFVQRLVRRMSYQIGLVSVEIPTTTGPLPTAPVSTIAPERVPVAAAAMAS